MFFNLNLCSGPGISGHSPLPLFRFEAAKSANFNILAFLEGFDDSLNEPINHSFSFNFC